MKTRVIFRNIQITNLISNRNKFYSKFNQISWTHLLVNVKFVMLRRRYWEAIIIFFSWERNFNFFLECDENYKIMRERYKSYVCTNYVSSFGCTRKKVFDATLLLAPCCLCFIGYTICSFIEILSLISKVAILKWFDGQS